MLCGLLPGASRRPRKKLRAAVRHWLRGGGRDADNDAAALAAFGVDAASIAEALSGHEYAGFGVWPESEAPLTLLIAMRTQVRRGGMDGLVYGLDYGALPLVMQQIGIEFDTNGEVFALLQIAESEMVCFRNTGR